jgi:hypothetical protein
MDEGRRDKKKEEEVHFVDKRRFRDDGAEPAADTAAEPQVAAVAEDAGEGRATAQPSTAGAAGEGQVSAQPPRASAETPSRAETPPRPESREPPPPQLTELPDIYALLSAYAATLGSQAFVWMGLLKDPISGKVRKDMAQAKVAIDACEFLIGQIQPKLDEQESRELARMLSDLKVNFVSQSRAG